MTSTSSLAAQNERRRSYRVFVVFTLSLLACILDRTRLVLQPMQQWKKLDRQYRYPFFRQTRVASDVYKLARL
ncbi:MAG: hypothetical protein K9K79_03810 [Desulfohalobiaceae bacterium]|nr:hypothetical protein [Desulfohalobiaceae bacterium]